jgi:hypothetical protein
VVVLHQQTAVDENQLLQRTNQKLPHKTLKNQTKEEQKENQHAVVRDIEKRVSTAV